MKVMLPETFLARVREQLGEEFPDFLASYEQAGRRGIRINTLKTTAQEIIRQAPFHMEPVPWAENGFFVGDGDDPAGHPFYRAGLYYIQEPSAQTPADRLDVRPDDKVLDLCAAPGGKATALAAKLAGSGLLVANDASASRCRALLHNLELAGPANIIVTNALPSELEKHFPAFFDRIMVDAPCSGEGMFRREPEVAAAWSPERVKYFAAQQRSIVASAVRMLKPGGRMMYSTCTFSGPENEGSVSFLLENFPEMHLLEIRPYAGFSHGNPAWGNGDPSLAKTVRIWPHKMDGAGHFMALLEKDGPEEQAEESGRAYRKERKGGQPGYNRTFNKEEKEILDGFLRAVQMELPRQELENRGGRVYWLPFGQETAAGLKFLRCGLYMGELKKKRFEPSQALALYGGIKGGTNVLELKAEDPRLAAYFRGETISLENAEQTAENGWILVKCAGHPVGFGKKTGGVLKNKYLWLK